MRSLSYLNKYFKKYKWHLIFGFIFIIFSNIFQVYTPQIIKQATNFITEVSQVHSLDETLNTSSTEKPKAIEWFEKIFDQEFIDVTSLNEENLLEVIFKAGIFLAILYIFVYILRGIFLFFTRQTIIIMSRLIEYDLKNEIYHHYQGLSTAFYKRNKTGDLMNRISEDVSKVRMYLGPAIMYTLNLMVIFILAITSMIAISPKLTLYVLLPLPVMSIIIYFVSTIINKKSEKVQEQQSRLSSLAQEFFSGIRVLKAYSREDYTNGIFEKDSDLYKERSMELVKVNALFMPAIISLISLSTILTIYLGGRMLISGEGGITHGDIVAFVFYINMLTWPFASVGWVTSLVQRASASQERINEFLLQSSEIKVIDDPKIVDINSIEFKNVTFDYPDTGIRALNDISFKINKGDTIAIIGATGSGKSTIANLILRQYDCTSGKILIDGSDIRTVDIDKIRNEIGYVPQEVFLFSDSIKNNISFGSSGADMEQIEDASKKADVYDNIIEFPDRFETILGERGITLSGGQKQRVSIARAIIKKPELLIFDDSLSAVDTETEEKILSNLRKTMNNKTTLIISHRVSTIMNADQIFVISEGKIAEKGTHEDLISKDGIYSKTYEKQLWEERKVLAS